MCPLHSMTSETRHDSSLFNDRNILNQNEHGLIINDVIELAYNNNIKRIILDDLIEGVSSDLKQKVETAETEEEIKNLMDTLYSATNCER